MRIEAALRALKTRGDYACLPMSDVREFCNRIGFEEVWTLETKWARG